MRRANRESHYPCLVDELRLVQVSLDAHRPVSAWLPANISCALVYNRGR